MKLPEGVVYSMGRMVENIHKKGEYCMKDWWCPTCKMAIDGKQVTYQGFHELCGTYLEDCQDQTDEEKMKVCVKYLLEYNLSPEEYNEMYKIYNEI